VSVWLWSLFKGGSELSTYITIILILYWNLFFYYWNIDIVLKDDAQFLTAHYYFIFTKHNIFLGVC
jgi:hypothetical protein